MLGKIGEMAKALGNLDVNKATDTVDALWDDRDKIVDTANLVWDNRDAIKEVVEFFGDNKETTLGIVRELPDLLATTGSGITKAGESAVAASGFLIGDGDEEGAVADITALAADALSHCVNQLDGAVDVMRRAGDEIADIGIPTVDPKFTEVAGFKVVTGIDFGTLPVAGEVSERMQEGAANLASISEDFGVVAEQLKRLGARLSDTGGDLNNVGSLLQETGTTLTSPAAPGS